MIVHLCPIYYKSLIWTAIVATNLSLRSLLENITYGSINTIIFMFKYWFKIDQANDTRAHLWGVFFFEETGDRFLSTCNTAHASTIFIFKF